MREPSHLTFVKQYLNWERVKERLLKYKHIAATFPLSKLKKCSNKAPFYCHYLGWRLGTWENEDWFEFFDNLLEISSNLPGWDYVSHIPGGCDYGNFWSFVWELQTAVFFSNHLGLKTAWRKDGPDFQVSVESTDIFIECTTYHKSFGLSEFISELFQCISFQINTLHTPFLKFSLPKNNNIEAFLDVLFNPYLDPSFLHDKITETQHKSPVMLPIPPGAVNFYIYLENQDAANKNFELEKELFTAGNPESFLEIALREIINNKTYANNLPKNRPNLLMVNFMLGKDWQLAATLRTIQKPCLGKTLDGIFISTCGIDRIPMIQDLFVYFPDISHPLARFLKKPISIYRPDQRDLQ